MIISNIKRLLILCILSFSITCLILTVSFQPASFALFQQLSSANSSTRLPLIVIGILSAEQNACFRSVQRQVFVTQAKAYAYMDIRVFFLLDHATPALEEERLTHNDIFYLNSSTHGWNKEFAKKLHTWYRFVERNFPDAILVGRMDDDVFCCVPQMFDRLLEVKDPFLYYGLRLNVPKRCPTKDCVDDMFFFIGMELVRRIVRDLPCIDDHDKNCSPDGYAWQRIREWTLPYSNEIRFVSDNRRFIFFFDFKKDNPRKNFDADARMTQLYTKHGKLFCKNYLLFHKASVKYIYQMNKENAIELGDFRRLLSIDKDMLKADSCVTD